MTSRPQDMTPEAGPALNELIATRVMRWEAFTCGYFGTDEETPRMRELASWMEAVEIEEVGDYFIDVASDKWVEADAFSPSTDVADAFDALAQVGGIVTIKRQMNEWFVSIGSVTMWAATLPLAICAALLAATASSALTPDQPAVSTEPQ
jgi:hypothetical protein